MNLEKNFSENNFAICFQFSLGIRGELTKYEKELSTLKNMKQIIYEKEQKFQNYLILLMLIFLVIKNHTNICVI